VGGMAAHSLSLDVGHNHRYAFLVFGISILTCGI
jgi:hypothetical protein